MNIVMALLLAPLLVLGATRPDPLYERIARDTAAGEPIRMTVFVALCDTSSQSVVAGDHAGHCRGNPARDLYWSVPSGARGFLDKHFERISYATGVSKRVAARGTWKKTVDLGERLRAHGAADRAVLEVTAIAYRGPAIGDAVRDFIAAIASDGPHLIGFLGHDYFMDIDDPRALYDLASARTPTQHRGVFALSCLSHQYFRPALGQATSHILVLNRTFTYPSFFTVDGLLAGVLAGESHDEILDRAARRFAAAQKKPFATIRAGLAGP